MHRWMFLGTLTTGLLVALGVSLQAARVSIRRGSRAPLRFHFGAAVIGLAAVGCVSTTESPATGSGHAGSAVVALFLGGAALFLVISGILAVVFQRRRRRRLEEILVAVLAGSMCGALWVVLVAAVVDAARPGAIGPVLLVVGVVTALGVAVLLSMRESLGEVVGLSAMTVGFHSLMLPIGALIAFVVAGAQWPTTGRPGMTAVVLGIRLAGHPSMIGLSVGGLLLGVFLVFLGDRRLRGVTPPAGGPIR